MSTDREHRHLGRDKELQHRDGDQKENNEDLRYDKMSADNKKTEKITGNPERLRDNDHRMDKRINDVQGEVSYGQNTHQPNEEPKHNLERHWSEIRDDYRKKYPHITDEDVNFKVGEFDVMAMRIAKRTQRTPEEIHKEISNWKL